MPLELCRTAAPSIHCRQAARVDSPPARATGVSSSDTMFAIWKYLEFSQLLSRSQPPFLLLYITKMFTYQPSKLPIYKQGQPSTSFQAVDQNLVRHLNLDTSSFFVHKDKG
jgi:hypothetical protein